MKKNEHNALIRSNKVIRHCTFDLMALDNGRYPQTMEAGMGESFQDHS